VGGKEVEAVTEGTESTSAAFASRSEADTSAASLVAPPDS
jgi:hypothetical protein